jgi:hypothetical protein
MDSVYRFLKAYMGLIVNGTDYIQIPVGTTAQRPTAPAKGMIRVNTTTNALEVYSGTAWVTWKAF